MEFTKAEKRLLDLSLAQEKRVKREQRGVIISGILLALIGIGVWMYCYFRIIPAIEAPFKEAEASISNMQVQTKWETSLKQMLLKTTRQLADDKKALVETKSMYLGFYFLLLAIFIIGTYYTNRIYRSIIRKIKTSQSSPY